MEYVFTLKYRLNDRDGDDQTLVDRLFDAGCHDAVLGIGQPGRLALEFTRGAEVASVRSKRQSPMWKAQSIARNCSKCCLITWV